MHIHGRIILDKQGSLWQAADKIVFSSFFASAQITTGHAFHEM
jgi:hypothetical protein